MTASLPILGLLLVAGCPGGIPVEARGTGPVDHGSIEREVHRLVNQERAANGLPPLLYHEEIAGAARAHSAAMADGTRPPGHEGFRARVDSLRAVVSFRAIAENVAMNDHPAERSPAVTVRGWLESPGHRRNLLGDFARTGVGVARRGDGTFFYTQIYID